MQKKASYRLLKWTLLLGTVASMATACVVTSGDGDDDDDTNFGGEGGTTSSAAGKTSGGAGTTSTAGKTSAGAGGSATAGAGGKGGSAPTEPAGVCMGNDDPEPTMLPSCAPDAKDADDSCRKCMRASCCTEWKTCFGDEPKIACGWGPKPSDDEDRGQYDCIRNCYDVAIETSTDLPEDIIRDCSGECLQQCDSDNVIMDATSDLVACAVEKCNDDCFPAPM